MGIDFPDFRDRFDSIPARRHAHVHERHGVRPVLLQRALDDLQRLLTLRGKIQFELDLTPGRLLFTKKRGLHFVEAIRAASAKDLAEVRVDTHVVIHDEQAAVETVHMFRFPIIFHVPT